MQGGFFGENGPLSSVQQEEKFLVTIEKFHKTMLMNSEREKKRDENQLQMHVRDTQKT